ncbi:MAG: hypothetical protein NT015_07410 [Alphaproteobacteria bacterium]|nr:hypothetical protein [Alphaproteobacteria bacterium]
MDQGADPAAIAAANIDDASAEAAAKLELKSRRVHAPYPGLNFYDPKDEASTVFAGRKLNVEACKKLVGESRLLVLHGKTGCGKSSFLRAGLAPAMISDGLTTQKEESGSLEIWRTGENPLKTMAQAFYAFWQSQYAASQEADGAHQDRAKMANVIADALKAEAAKSEKSKKQPHWISLDLTKDQAAAFVAAVSEKHRVLIDAIQKLTEADLTLRPVFVLDQAEEMWTLAPAGAETSGGARMPKHRKAFYQFIQDLDRKTKNVRLIISMRTEYKGLFDDELRYELRESGPSADIKVAGYYLSDLEKDAIIEAIEGPTQKGPLEDGSRPYEKFKFSFKEGVAEKLANKLLDPKEVPRGGILPVLQVTCLRLWETTRKRRHQLDTGEAERSWEIKETDLAQVGEINRQIELFVQERLEQALQDEAKFVSAEPDRAADALKEIGERERYDILNEAEKWYRVLNAALVNVESDGRVTTKKASPFQLRERGKSNAIRAFEREHLYRDDKRETENNDAFDEKQSSCGRILRHLQANNILRIDSKLDQEADANGIARWSLGHDSVGLTLNRWSQRYGKAEGRSKMDMMMRNNIDARELDLFAPGELERYPLKTVKDGVWDHQILLYAVDKGFAARLGLDIETTPILDTVTGSKDRAPRKIRDVLKEMDRVDPSVDRASYVIAWPRSEFPLKAKNSDEVVRATQWTDVMITNAYQGYGFLCPPDLVNDQNTSGATFKAFEDINNAVGRGDGAAQRALDSNALGNFRKSVDLVFNYLRREPDATIWLFDESARTFLELVLKLSELGGGEDAWKRDAILRRAALVSDASNDDDDEDDAEDKSSLGDEERDGNFVPDRIFAKVLDRKGQKDFIIGTAVSRALATRVGFKSLIDVQDIPTLMEWHLISQHSQDEGKLKREKRRLTKEYQKTQTHTTWQLSLPHSEIGDERVAKLLFRLAALGFYTVEHIRTNMHDFVRYIDQHLQTTARRGAFKLDRDYIESAIKNCYYFLPFEHYATQFLERSSPIAYWQEGGNDTSRVREIYSAMLGFRADFFREFQQFNAQYIRLTRGKGAEENLFEISDKAEEDNNERLGAATSSAKGGVPAKEAARDISQVSAAKAVTLSEIETLRDRAWHHFRIMNFYDAARYMQRAREALTGIQPHDMLPAAKKRRQRPSH